MENKTHFQPGIYQAEVIDQQLGKSSGGHPQFVLTFLPKGKVATETELQSVEPWERTAYMVLTAKTVKYVLADLAEIGFDGDSFAKLDPLSGGDYHNFAGQVIAVDCEHSTYEGVTRERWSIHRERGGVEIEQLPPGDIRRLDRKFGKALKERPQAKPREAVAVAAEVQPSNIPF